MSTLTPPRPLTETEREVLRALAATIDRCGHPATFALLHELVVARAVIAHVRRFRRCLPRGAQAALDEAPHPARHAVEFPHD